MQNIRKIITLILDFNLVKSNYLLQLKGLILNFLNFNNKIHLTFKFLILSTIILFSGCASLNGNYNEQATIASVEKNITSKVETMNDNLKQTDEKITTMQTNIQNLQKSFNDLKNKNIALISSLNSQKEKNASLETTKLKPTRSTGLTILGEAELVHIEGVKQELNARVDTGATTSSLSASNIEEFERNGKKWVRFIVNTNNEENLIEAPIDNFVKVKQSSSAVPQTRIVVKLWLKLGDIRQNTEFTLANRSHMTYPVLLGRTFLKDNAIVDVSKKYTQNKKD